MKNLAETRRRKSNDDEKVAKKKARRSGSDTMEWLKERYELENRMKEKQMEEERTRNGEATRRHEDIMQIMVQNQQKMQHMQQQAQQQMVQVMISQQSQMLMGNLEKFSPK